MKMKAYIAVPLLGGLMFVAGRTTAKSHDTLSQKTLENLSTAMHGEAFAYAKYSLYAKMAQANGSPEVADLFEKAANTERFEHFAEEARLARLVGTDAENLKDAIKGESYEADRMYREFAEEAAAAGDKTAAARFEEIRRDEMGHRDAFTAALAKVENKTAVSH